MPIVATFSRLRLIQASRAAAANVVDPLDALCGGGQCPLTAGQVGLYKDRTHLRSSVVGLPLFGYLDDALWPPTTASAQASR